MPITKTVGEAKIGELSVTPQLLQQADTTTQLLDIQQYNSCLNVDRATSAEEREFYAKQQADAFNTLITLAQNLRSPPSENAVKSAVAEAATKSRILRARGMLRRSLKQNECWTP